MPYIFLTNPFKGSLWSIGPRSMAREIWQAWDVHMLRLRGDAPSQVNGVDDGCASRCARIAHPEACQCQISRAMPRVSVPHRQPLKGSIGKIQGVFK